MTMQIGDQFHLLTSMTFDGRVHQRGETVIVTEKLLADSVDRLGNSWLDDVDDEQAQLRKWGQRKLAPGACPPEVEFWNEAGDSGGLAKARDDARLRAATLTNPAERAVETARIREKFGAKPMQWSLGHVPTSDPSRVL